ncbi:MAG: isoprenylcysteine carboxylmethyltransferase family protein [Panacibacter sp.]
MTLFDLLITGSWFIFFFVWLISAAGAKKDIRKNRHQQHSRVRLLFFIIIVLFLNPGSLQRLGLAEVHILPSDLYVQVTGVIICAAGIAFAAWAKIHLGKNWGMPMSQKENPDLITTGPYHFVRHPIYAGICMGLLGSAITEGFSWFLWFVFISASFIYSAKKEEATMKLNFPEAYIEYMKHTKMIIPFIF